jgi:hypothetical protein
MAQQPATLRALLTRAAGDPAFLERLASDPIGVAQSEGVRVDTGFLKEKLGVPGATDLELVEMLQARLSAPVQGYSADAFCICM